MKVEVNLSEEEFEILEDIAGYKKIGIADFIHDALLEKLEDEEDIRAADKAYAEYLKNPVASPAEEVFARLGL